MQNWKYIFIFLGLIISAVWLAVFSLPDSKLHLIACNVGEGDAILATAGKTQILVDGGPDSKVLDCLGRHMPFWDREIELVILTHPQKDHFQGLIDVFKRYKVDTFLTSGLDSSDRGYQVLKNAVGGSRARVVYPTSGMVIRAKKIYLDILYPSDEKVLGLAVPNAALNDYSLVTSLRLGSFTAVLTGDISPKSIGELLAQGKIGKANYIKVPHHGSKNGLTRNLLEKIVPGGLPRNEVYGVISVGKNSYGHPHKETLDLLTEFGVKVFRTDEIGDIEVISDGTSWNLK